MNLDVHTAIQTALAITILIILYSIWSGIRSIRKARDLKFFRMRRDRMVTGWRMLFLALLLIILAIFLNGFAEPIIYNFFPPTVTLTLTPTLALTPTITQSPTVTLSPTITLTPSVSDTPTITPTPHIPLAIEALFESTVTPVPGSVFSPLQFALALDENFLPVDSNTVFQNPVGHLYAHFSYDQMSVGAQWTALWYRGTDLVHYETKPWDGGTGGFGYTDWEPEPYEWLPGEYEVQIFAGFEWKVSGRFTVEGEAPTPPPSPTPTATQTLTPSPSSSPTITPTPSPSPTRTNTPRPSPTSTRMPTLTPRPSDTRQPSQTPTPTESPPFYTPSPTITRTRAPTFTPWPTTATFTHAPTFTPQTPTVTNTRAPTFTPSPFTP